MITVPRVDRMIKVRAKAKELETFLKNNNSDFYSFSFALISDDLQAQQIVVDAAYRLTVEERELIFEFLSLKEDGAGESILFKLKKFFFQNVFNIARKRFEQLKKTLNDEVKSTSFSQLSINEKAILFLKYKTNWSMSDIEDILGKGHHQTIALLNRARHSLLEIRSLDIGLELPKTL